MRRSLTERYASVGFPEARISWVRVVTAFLVIVVFIAITYMLGGWLWDMHERFEDVAHSNLRGVVRQVAHEAVRHCLRNLTTSGDQPTTCTWDTGDSTQFDVRELSFRITVNTITLHITESIPLGRYLYCTARQSTCHMWILYVVNWWFGSRHSILFGVVMFALIAVVCMFIYPQFGLLWTTMWSTCKRIQDQESMKARLLAKPPLEPSVALPSQESLNALPPDSYVRLRTPIRDAELRLIEQSKLAANGQRSLYP